ncbi:MazG nucleotide pyrophosphohydrolase domain-containing protein [Parendozoicomonas haliclonae]|uniref:Nucleoside triphosphate pyrophosphohydrolase n=1 Tax=Parendozoicomonas haliclonae TaxID=1960125 RepID=A0A1X7AI77_9GAMM|nr:MazG nucleotide pyrophosphohydrolase domain-containing protein [Parendozoicomonas haliclonae]SMA44287.1 nucleoside triphosphate pyrophosphohydrolase [Parendozoicomonas haliclonae]
MMMGKKLEELLAIVHAKNRFDQSNTWFNGSGTYLDEIKKEVDEVAEEVHAGRRCYLEDELGDVLWDYLNLVICLEQEQGISAERVIERAIAKYGERIEGITSGTSWDTIKAGQKQKLQDEYQQEISALIK